MFGLFDSAICPIGIDAGTHTLRMVQFRHAAAGLSLQAAWRVELNSIEAVPAGPGRVVAAIRRALDGHDFTGRQVVLSLPAECVHARSVRLPQMPDADLTQALQWEAKDRFGFEIAENGGQLVWFRAGEVRRGTEVKDELLLFAVEGGVLSEYVHGIAGLGLQIMAVDLAPCATFRGIQRAVTGIAGGTAAILDIGHVGAQFLITRDNELVFFKRIDIGAKNINDAVAEKLGISVMEAIQMRSRLTIEPAGTEQAAPLDQALRDAMRGPLEELAREVDMCMRYYVVTFRGARPETMLLAGQQGGSAAVREALASALALQIEEAQALRGIQNLGDAARPDRSGEWATAAGLSLYSVAARAALEAAA